VHLGSLTEPTSSTTNLLRDRARCESSGPAAFRLRPKKPSAKDAFLTLAVHCIDRHLIKIDASWISSPSWRPAKPVPNPGHFAKPSDKGLCLRGPKRQGGLNEF
jgi:hypothetical protein